MTRPGRKLSPREAGYLDRLQEGLSPAEWRRFVALPWTRGRNESEYERALSWRMQKVLDEGVAPKALLAQLERHFAPRRRLLTEL